MKPTTKKVLLGMAVSGAVLFSSVLAYAATKPDTFKIERTTSVQAQPAKILPMLTDFKRWQAWSPYEKDPSLQRSYSGPDSGKGAVYAWEGKEAGKGRMEILAVTPDKVTVKLDFIEPMSASNICEFTLLPQNGLTTVSWSMSGANPYFGKVMSVFLDIDTFVGGDFEAGLAKLKQQAETVAQASQ